MTARRARSVALCAILTGCTITRSVEPVGQPIDATLCFEENEQVWSKQFLPALRQEFERHGVRTSVYRGERPADCRYHATYVAKWHWDLATYLSYADVQVFDEDRMIGRVLYDAGGGEASLAKFGGTMGKVGPLVDEMLAPPR